MFGSSTHIINFIFGVYFVLSKCWAIFFAKHTRLKSIMKHFLAALFVLVTITACDTSSTTSGGMDLKDEPVVTGNYSGTFSNTSGSQEGDVRLTLVENSGQSVSGNIIFDASGRNCLSNAQISGTVVGLNLSIIAEIVSSSGSGTLAVELSISEDRNRLSGTYVTSGDACSNSTGAGTMEFTRT